MGKSGPRSGVELSCFFVFEGVELYAMKRFRGEKTVRLGETGALGDLVRSLVGILGVIRAILSFGLR
jgi:hypothetical protein